MTTGISDAPYLLVCMYCGYHISAYMFIYLRYRKPHSRQPYADLLMLQPDL